MKYKYTRLFSAMMLGIGVTACGGGGGGDEPKPDPNTTYQIQSIVQNIDGVSVSSAKVCLDVNGDAICNDSDVEVKTTDSNGAAIHTFTEEQFKSLKNMIAISGDGSVYSHVLTDSVVNAAKSADVKQGVIYINPITTQLTKYAKANNLSHDAAIAKLASIMNVNSTEFTNSVKKDSVLEIIIRSLDAVGDNLNDSTVISIVTGAGDKVSTALSDGLTSDEIVTSYKNYRDFDHLEKDAENHAPVITDLKSALAACRTYMFAATATDEDKDPLTFTWTFSDGSSLTGPNVQHIFAANGTYNVQLSVTDGKAPVSKSQSVTVNSDMCGSFTELKALFTFKATELQVEFSNVSSGDIESYEWDFGDEEKSSEENPTHVYKAEGTYTVSLIVVGKDGTKSEAYTYPVKVEVNPVPVDPDIQYNVNGLTVTFTTKDVENPVWVFSDGEQLSGFSVTKTFAAGGKYPVVLMHSKGSKTFEVEVVSPEDPSVSIGEPVVSYLNVKMNASAENAPSNATFSWNMGDGTTLTGSDVEYTYSKKGTYTVTVSLLDESGKVLATSSKDVTVAPENHKPVAGFTYTVNGVQAQFTNTSKDDDGDTLIYSWDFGDNQTSTEKSPTHVYANVTKQYTVKLTVSDGALTDEFSNPVDIVYVPDSHKPVAVMTNSISGMVLSFDASKSTDEDGDTLTYSWNFGDNSTSKEVSGTHTYAEPGEYTVTLVVSDGGLNSDPVSDKYVAVDELLKCTLE